MKYLFINSVYGVRSTGKIIAEQCHMLQAKGHQCAAAYGRETADDPDVRQIRIGKRADYLVHAVLSRIFDLHGLCSKRATKVFLKQVETDLPDVIWIHNLHGYYINFEILFRWLKDHPQIKVYWTLHDCWAFTGHCAYFTMAGCDRWKSGCSHCTQLHTYPKTCGFDHVKRNYLKKREAFTGMENLELITPSRWLADLTRESFLAEYPVCVIHNSIDREVFRPTESDFRKRYGLENVYLVLGVAVGWEETKGLQDMLKLRQQLSDQYVICLVGATDRQTASFPRGVIGINGTADQRELAAIYTAADVFVNPTHQDNYPTVNLEAGACGTPVITYNVGGSPESVPPENVVPENDIAAMALRIMQICEA